eukprot:372369-Rhodomonas_salina.1
MNVVIGVLGESYDVEHDRARVSFFRSRAGICAEYSSRMWKTRRPIGIAEVLVQVSRVAAAAVAGAAVLRAGAVRGGGVALLRLPGSIRGAGYDGAVPLGVRVAGGERGGSGRRAGADADPDPALRAEPQ